MVGITTHDTHMDTQQLMKTIEEQNQVIIAKDATINILQKDLRDAKDELHDMRFNRSWQKFHNRWVDEAIRQKSVHIVGGFEYNTRYVSLTTTITLILMVNSFIVFILCINGAFK